MVALVCQIGLIAGFSWIALRPGRVRPPPDATFAQIAGVALLGGIGFTMSIFIAELAFAGQTTELLMAKTGILIASVFTGLGGFIGLRWFATPTQ